MAAEAEEEVRLEVEAVAAVYGEDCRVVREFPPHLVVHVRPRTADDSSQQYPKEPPHVYTVESKGLDENRQAYLISSMQNKAKELSYYPMLVTLCEEAGEILSNMNHPAGDCPLCLYALVPEDKDDFALPFMKLMSCYHCFHSDCILRWWEWLQHDDANSKKSTTAATTGDARTQMLYNGNLKGFCPVCRKLFDEKDIEHVRDLLDANTSQLASLIIDLCEDEKELLHSEPENKRREKFKSLFNLQQEQNGLIEPKKDLAIQPGMYVSLPPTVTTTSAAGDSIDSCEGTITSTTEVEPRTMENDTSGNKQNYRGPRRRNRAFAPRREPHGQPAGQQRQREQPAGQQRQREQPAGQQRQRGQPAGQQRQRGQPAGPQWQRKDANNTHQ